MRTNSRCSLITALVVAASTALVQTQSPAPPDMPIVVAPGAPLDVSLDDETTRLNVHRPRIAGIVVVDEQLARPLAAAHHSESPMAYPAPPGGSGRGVPYRTLFVWGENLPETAGAGVASLNADVKYEAGSALFRYKPGPRRAGEARRAGEQKAALQDPTFTPQRYSTLMLQANLGPGITPGPKELTINGARGEWTLLFSNQAAVMRFVRESGQADYDPTSVFYPNDTGFIEIVYAADVGFKEIDVAIGLQPDAAAGRYDVQPVSVMTATKLDGRTLPTYRTPPIYLDDVSVYPLPAESEGEVRLPVRAGDRLEARLQNPLDALLVSPATVADIAADPASLGPSWLSALKRVAVCRGEAGVTPDNKYAGQEALEVARYILVAWKSRRTVTVLKGDHAAAILIRDEFVRMAEEMLSQAKQAAALRRPSAPASAPFDVEKVQAAVKRAVDAGDCNLEELLVLAGQDAPAVLARVLPRLVKADDTGRWVADRVAQGFVRSLHIPAAAVRALEELAAIDDAYKAMALAVVTLGAGAALELGGAAAAGGYAILAGDAIDIAVFGTKSVQRYLNGERQYAYAQGATPILGSDAFLGEAAATRESAFMTAVGLIAPGVSGAFGARHIRNLQAANRGRAILEKNLSALDDLSRLSETKRLDLAAYYQDMYANASRGRRLSPADKAAFERFQAYFAKAGQPMPSAEELAQRAAAVVDDTVVYVDDAPAPGVSSLQNGSGTGASHAPVEIGRRSGLFVAAKDVLAGLKDVPKAMEADVEMLVMKRGLSAYPAVVLATQRAGVPAKRLLEAGLTADDIADYLDEALVTASAIPSSRREALIRLFLEDNTPFRYQPRTSPLPRGLSTDTRPSSLKLEHRDEVEQRLLKLGLNRRDARSKAFEYVMNLGEGRDSGVAMAAYDAGVPAERLLAKGDVTADEIADAVFRYRTQPDAFGSAAAGGEITRAQNVLNYLGDRAPQVFRELADKTRLEDPPWVPRPKTLEDQQVFRRDMLPLWQKWTEEELAKLGFHPLSARRAAQPWVLKDMLAPRAAVVGIARQWGVSLSELQSKLGMDITAVRAALDDILETRGMSDAAQRRVLVDAALAQMRW
jgi:hypothetical protein